MAFSVDNRIESTSFILGDWPLSRVLLKNDQTYPWLILVPRKEGVEEIYQLDGEERQLLIEEINQLSLLVTSYFQPDKLNVGALGNVVPQLHVHVVGRRRGDPLWPQGIWQAGAVTSPYEVDLVDDLVFDWRELIQKEFV